MKKHIPNFITSLNLICGAISIHLFYNGEGMLAIWFILAALVFDFMDGFLARLLKVKSEIGKQLDSLADVITFGLAPGVVMFFLITMGLKAWESNLPSYTPYIAFIIPVFSALRLAKFNVDTRQSDSFIGLPTPANAILIFSLFPQVSGQYLSPFFPWNEYLFYFILNPYLLLAATLILSFLLIAPLPLIALKFKSASWKDNSRRYVFVIISILLIGLFWFTAIPIVIVLYIIVSLSGNSSRMQSHKNENPHEIQS